MTHIKVGIEPGQVWENRNRRRNGTRERLTVLGVPWAGKAAELRDAGVTTLDAWRQHEPDVTRGLAYARGELSLEQLLAEVER